ncbi:hypothetical protein MRX96_042496, partial [Rhipicephalus microplus]
MGSVNVNRSLTDQFYRYKMPKIIAKVEGKGNGIKTVLVNMSEVAKALNRPPTYPTKYFGCELGAQTQLDAKNDRYIVNGAHEAAKLQDILDGFIRRYVLCASCDNPETVLGVLQRKGVITTKRAPRDPRQQLWRQLLPPPRTLGPPRARPSAKSRDERRSTTEAPGKLQNGGGGEDQQHESDPQDDDWGDDVDDDWAEDTSEDAK